jgi:hypothetical protein
VIEPTIEVNKNFIKFIHIIWLIFHIILLFNLKTCIIILFRRNVGTLWQFIHIEKVPGKRFVIIKKNTKSKLEFRWKYRWTKIIFTKISDEFELNDTDEYLLLILHSLYIICSFSNLGKSNIIK